MTYCNLGQFQMMLLVVKLRILPHYKLYLYNMDAHLDKRLKFRQNIRRKAIEQIKKSKRQVIQEYNQRAQQEQEQQKLYLTVIRNSDKVFEQQDRYLQILIQALNWEGITHYKSTLSQILLNLVKFYDCSQPPQTTTLILQCIATIFFQTNIQFNELVKRSLIICYEQLCQNKVGDGNSKLIRNRCLIGIWNISSTENEAVLDVCEELGLLECLEETVEEFPMEDGNKVAVLGIYGNFIGYHLQYVTSRNLPLTYYPYLLKSCVQQSSNMQILQKTTQSVTNLLESPYKQLNKFQLIEDLQCLFMQLLKAGFYVQGTQKLIAASTQLFAQNQNQQIQISSSMQMERNHVDSYRHFQFMFDILEMIVDRYGNHVADGAVGRGLYWMGVIVCKYFQDAEEHKLQQLVTLICNYWVNLEDDCSYQFQLHFLKLLKLTLQNFNLSLTLYNNRIQRIQNNSIQASTWQVIQQFLISTKLEQTQKILQYLLIFQFNHIYELIEEQYRSSIMQKIQGCYYSQWKNQDITRIAELVLKKFNMGV